MEKLTIICDEPITTQESLTHLAGLKQLGCLTCHCYRLPVKELCDILAKRMVPIKRLILSAFKLDSNTASSLSKLRQIQELQLSNVCIKSDQLTKAVKGMRHLKSLAVIQSGRVSVADVKKITKTAREISSLAIINRKTLVFNEDDFKTITELVKNRDSGIKLEIKTGL